MLPTASTLMRPCEVATAGSVTDSVPSLGVEPDSQCGKVMPPSVDKLIFTLAALTGAPLVPATDQVTGSDAPAAALDAVACEVTRNGVVPLTVIVESALPAPPPAGFPSRAVSRKCSVRAEVGRNSEKQSTVE